MSTSGVRAWALNVMLLCVCVCVWVCACVFHSSDIKQLRYPIHLDHFERGRERKWVRVVSVGYYNQDLCFIFPLWDMLWTTTVSPVQDLIKEKNTIKHNTVAKKKEIHLIYLYFDKQSSFFLFFFSSSHRRWHPFVPEGRCWWESREQLSGHTI